MSSGKEGKGKGPVIIKKVKKGHGGHHGGAWKVAYADFVTAMMAFFMVMWIIGMDQSVKSAIEGYFSNPMGFDEGPSSTMNIIKMGASPQPQTSILPVQLLNRRIEQQRYKDIGEKIKLELNAQDGLGDLAAQVEVVISDEGMRIELIEGDDGETFFAFGSAVLKPAAERAIRIIAQELQASTAPLVLEGHTDARQYQPTSSYSNWELSADRANAARRQMERAGLGTNRVSEIRGHADKFLRVPENPLDNANRRISILLPYTTRPDVITGGAAEAAAPAEDVVPSGRVGGGVTPATAAGGLGH
jgi:chemotaxis protein MotB